MAEEGKREVREKDIEPGIGDIPEKGIYGISPTIDPDLLEFSSVVPKKEGGVTRRRFIVGASAAGGLLALTGCVPSPTPPTETPIVTEATGIPLSPTLEIKTPTPEVTPTEKITPSPTITKEPTVTPEPSPTVQPSPTQTREPTPAQEPCEVERCECYSELALYHNPTEEESFSKLIPGTNKTFIVKERKDGWMLIEVREPTGAVWEAWTNDVSGAYGPVGQRPTPTPRPTEVQPPACEVPHFPERTTDRQIGCVNSMGERLQIVLMGAENVRWDDLRFIGRGIVWLRGAKIIELDDKNQIITFDLGGGLVIQKKFTETLVVMWAHNLYRNMPIEQAQQIGGNFCDLAVDDMVAIIFSSQQEAVNPSTEGELLGLEIVQ